MDSRVPNEEDICEVGFGAKPAINYIFGDITTAEFNSTELTSRAFTKSEKKETSPARLSILFKDSAEFPEGTPSSAKLTHQVAESQLREFRKYARDAKIGMLHKANPSPNMIPFFGIAKIYLARLRRNMEDLIGRERLENW